MNTVRRQAALDFIAARQRRVTVGPTLRELAKHLGVFPNAAQNHVVALRVSGILELDDQRGLVVMTEKSPTRLKHREPERQSEPLFRVPDRRPILKPSASKL